MKKLFILTSFLLTFNAFATEVSCYKFNSGNYNDFDTIKIESKKNQVKSVLITSVSTPSVIEDKNPAVVTMIIKGRCVHNRMMDLICAPNVKVPSFVEFENNLIQVLYFTPQGDAGRILFNGEYEYTQIYRVKCD